MIAMIIALGVSILSQAFKPKHASAIVQILNKVIASKKLCQGLEVGNDKSMLFMLVGCNACIEIWLSLAKNITKIEATELNTTGKLAHQLKPNQSPNESSFLAAILVTNK